MINARAVGAEGVWNKPAFRSAIWAKRCLIPASAFFEWKREQSKKRQPYLIKLKGAYLFAFAGMWEI